MTPEEISKVVDGVAMKLKDIAADSARQEANMVLGQLLHVDAPGLQDRVDSCISALVRERVSRTVWIEVASRPRRKRR